ncbi:MAG TPA: type III secretion system stator protein SctL [Pyrinomonadaceae bacterium]|nr:type III secretion system stator protein SctL [Pyrinomonadaceae bacterium]
MSTTNSGNVIKRAKGAGGLAGLRGRSVIKRAVAEAEAEARRILAEAEREAAGLRESAAAAARELREAAYLEGREEALAEFNRLLLDARERRDTALSDVERDVLRLAVKLAEKIIGREIQTDPATVADIVAAALRHARQHETLTVRVHPSDFPHVQTFRARLDPSGRARFLDLVSDPGVAPGGCVIESESGTVDARLETQLRVLERALLAQASGESS